MAFEITQPTYFPRARTKSLDDAPAAPSSYDDEFTGTSLDAKWTRTGFTVGFGSTPIDPYANFADAHRDSHNSYRPSWYMLQPASVGSISLLQPVTPATDCFFWARLAFNMRYTSNANDDFEIGLRIAASSAGAPDYNNCVLMSLNESSAGIAHAWGGKLVAGVGTFSFGRDLIPGSIAASSFHQPWCYVGIQKVGTTYHFCVGSPNGTWLWLNSQTHASTMAFAGIYSLNTSGAAPGNMILGIDFFRYKEGKFIP